VLYFQVIVKNLILALTILCFIITSVFGTCPVYAQEIRLPAPGVRVNLSPEFNPPILKGIKVHPDNPFRFDFILDQGDSPSLVKEGDRGSLKQEATKLIKYFLASLTIPEKDLWVNLSPYEKDRIIPQSFGLTEMGRDLLAEDYMLKQITASLIYPEDKIGKKFWKRIYEEAFKKYGTTNIPVDTFNKVWIVPEKAVVYENAKAGTAYVVESKLKVMLEQDYLALFYNVIPAKGRIDRHSQLLAGIQNKNDINALGSQIIRQIVVPQLTKEVNENKNFAQLRQVYNSLILATWYKNKIKDSILAQVYEDKKKVAGIKPLLSICPIASLGGKDVPLRGSAISKRTTNDVEYVYQRYLQAFKKGVYNYIKEEQDPLTQQVIPRKYFSGGMNFFGNLAMTTTSDSAMLPQRMNKAEIVEVNIRPEDRAMIDSVERLLGEVDKIDDQHSRLLKYLNGLRANVRRSGSEEDRYYCELTYRLILYLMTAFPFVLDDELRKIHSGERFSKGQGSEITMPFVSVALLKGDQKIESLLNTIGGTRWEYVVNNLKKVLKIPNVGQSQPRSQAMTALTEDQAMNGGGEEVSRNTLDTDVYGFFRNFGKRSDISRTQIRQRLLSMFRGAGFAIAKEKDWPKFVKSFFGRYTQFKDVYQITAEPEEIQMLMVLMFFIASDNRSDLVEGVVIKLHKEILPAMRALHGNDDERRITSWAYTLPNGPDWLSIPTMVFSEDGNYKMVYQFFIEHASIRALVGRIGLTGLHLRFNYSSKDDAVDLIRLKGSLEKIFDLEKVRLQKDVRTLKGQERTFLQSLSQAVINGLIFDGGKDDILDIIGQNNPTSGPLKKIIRDGVYFLSPEGASRDFLVNFMENYTIENAKKVVGVNSEGLLEPGFEPMELFDLAWGPKNKVKYLPLRRPDSDHYDQIFRGIQTYAGMAEANLINISHTERRNETMITNAVPKSGPGGIDLTPANMNLQVKKEIASSLGNTPRNDTSEGINFHLDPSMLQQLQNAAGFVPVVIKIQPMTDLYAFLGISEKAGISPTAG